jgi:formamidopyrimidine-DNA glycosylase
MPELPEVEARRKILERHMVGRTITRTSAAPDTIVYDGVKPRTFSRALTGREVLAVRRKGKQLWMELDRRPWPTLHFGMGGSFFAYDRVSERPKYWKLEMVTDRGVRVAMTNPRRLGRIRLQEDPETEPPISKLGHDPLNDLPSPTRFRALISRRKAPIKAVLLDQGVFAGVGNWIADEVLYQACIDPRRRSHRLGLDELSRLRSRLGSVIRRAVLVDADSDRFPRTWLFHHRWGRKESAMTSRGEKIRFATVGGRTTAWVPEVQK